METETGGKAKSMDRVCYWCEACVAKVPHGVIDGCGMDCEKCLCDVCASRGNKHEGGWEWACSKVPADEMIKRSPYRCDTCKFWETHEHCPTGSHEAWDISEECGLCCHSDLVGKLPK